MTKASRVVPIVALLSGLVGFLLGREVWPRQPDFQARAPVRPVQHPAERTVRPARWEPPAPAEPTTTKKPDASAQPTPEAERSRARLSVQDTRSRNRVLPEPEGRTVDQKRHGLWREFFPDGSMAWQQEYDLGVPIGPFTRYHKNGRIAEEGTWRDGRKDGRWIQFDEHGTLIREDLFERGKLAGPIQLWGFPEAPRERSTVQGKYGGRLLRKIADPDVRASYTEFRDYGVYRATDYMGHTKVPKGYWVYVYPYWYVWSDKKK